MSKASVIQTSFTAGEVSKLAQGRVDIPRYKAGLDLCQNYIPLIQGPARRRSGTRFIAEVKDSSKFTRLVEFEFSATQAYILEFGDLYIRFYKDYGQITSGGPAYEVTTTYTEAELPDLQFAQSADTLYIVHGDHEPARLVRLDHDDWYLLNAFAGWGEVLPTSTRVISGPYLQTNSTTTTLTPSATSGLINVTASSVVGINGGAGFLTTDVKRSIRIKHGSTWGWGYITSRTSATVVQVSVSPDTDGGAFSATTASANWRLGAYNSLDGWPKVVCIHENRLIFAGSSAYPDRIDGSVIGDYGNFEPTNSAGTITSSDAYSFTLNSGTVDAIKWIKSDEKGMPVGTLGAEYVVRPSNANEAISPTNVNAKRLSTYGSANLPAIQLGKASIFIQRTKRKLRELTYFYEVDGFRAQDMSQLAEHITESGIKEIKGQKEPQPIVWACREDGALLSMTYEREDELNAAWAKHPLGGQSDADGADPIVESIAIIPSSDISTYDVWMIVKRHINGGAVRYIEYITAEFGLEDELEDAFFVDCGLTYYNPLTITGITKANPAVVTSVAHGLSNGSTVRVFNVVGMTEVNGPTYTVANVTANTFELSGIDSSLFTAYQSGGEIRKLVTTISGLDHLEGEVVDIFADGCVQPTRTVSGGAITLATAATKAQIGLGYVSRLKLLRLDAGAQDGTSIGKTRRIHNLSLLLDRTLGLKIGTDFNELDTIVFDTDVDVYTGAQELFSGLEHDTLPADYDTENQICLQTDSPYPSTILAVMPQLQTQDR